MRRLSILTILLLALCSCGGDKIDDAQTFPFLNENAYGIYNLDGKNSRIVYSETEHQLAVVKGKNNAFRIINPSRQKFFELSGLPSSLSKGDTFQAKFRQNWTDGISQGKTISLTVRRVEEGKVWMSDAGGAGYIIRY